MAGAHRRYPQGIPDKVSKQIQNELALIQKVGFAGYFLIVADLVNYMTYMSEPAQNDRVTIGLYALIVLSVLIGLAYALKKSYWQDVH